MFLQQLWVLRRKPLWVLRKFSSSSHHFCQVYKGRLFDMLNKSSLCSKMWGLGMIWDAEMMLKCQSSLLALTCFSASTYWVFKLQYLVFTSQINGIFVHQLRIQFCECSACIWNGDLTLLIIRGHYTMNFAKLMSQSMIAETYNSNSIYKWKGKNSINLHFLRHTRLHATYVSNELSQSIVICIVGKFSIC